MSSSFEFPGKYYEIIRRDFRNTQAETEFFASYLPPGGRVLDLGCGTGTNVRALAELGYSCIGVDQSQQFVDYAKNATARGVIDFVHARAADYETDQQFDLIYTIFVTLNYMDRADLPVLFRKVQRWLRPGGHFVVDIGHMLNFVDGYQPYIIAHHRHEGVLISFRKEPPSRCGQGHLIFVAGSPVDVHGES